jgi:hypothetical protein
VPRTALAQSRSPARGRQAVLGTRPPARKAIEASAPISLKKRFVDDHEPADPFADQFGEDGIELVDAAGSDMLELPAGSASLFLDIWQLVGIWRSSYKYSGGRARLWGRLARLAAILGWMKWFRTTWTLILISGGSV